MGKNIAIRYRLILAAAFAVGAVWIGAFLQLRELQAQQTRIASLRLDLEASRSLGRLSLAIARERGLSQGLLVASPEDRPQVARDVELVRAQVDALAPAVPISPIWREGRLSSELGTLRAAIDAVRTDGETSFDAYSALIGDLNLGASKQLSSAMLQIGMGYEHLNALRDAIEYAGQGRGTLQRHLKQGALPEGALAKLRERRMLTELFVARTAALSPAPLPSVAGPRWADWTSEWQAFFAAPEAYVATAPPDRWWLTATRAIDSLQGDLDVQLDATIAEASARIDGLQERALWAALTMVVLGLITVALLASSLSRVVGGLGRLVKGIDSASKGDLAVRIDVSHGDEFGQIGSSVNHLVHTLGNLVAEKEARAEADALTGLLNRGGIDRYLASRTNPNRKSLTPFGLAVVDIDHFKRVNDELGHLEGDRVLVAVAHDIRDALRPDDVVGRWGGEEFLVILAGGAELDLATAAEKIRARIEALDVGVGRAVTVSLGATLWSPGEALSDAFKRADEALYAAKAQGRNRIVMS